MWLVAKDLSDVLVYVITLHQLMEEGIVWDQEV